MEARIRVLAPPASYQFGVVDGWLPDRLIPVLVLIGSGYFILSGLILGTTATFIGAIMLLCALLLVAMLPDEDSLKNRGKEQEIESS